MNGRNLIATVLTLAALITGLFIAFPEINGSDIVDQIYAPAIFLTILLSGSSHSPSEIAGWIVFVGYTVLIIVSVVVPYAFLSEQFLIRGSFFDVDRLAVDFERLQPRAVDVDPYLAQIGQAIAELELKRRKHFFLKGIEELDPLQSADVVGAMAFMTRDKRSVRLILVHLEEQIARTRGSAEASAFMNRVAEEARKVLSSRAGRGRRRQPVA
jgi:hypothetical protein